MTFLNSIPLRFIPLYITILHSIFIFSQDKKKDIIPFYSNNTDITSFFILLTQLSFSLFKLANKISSLYFLVLALWFYLVLYVFYYPTSIGCTERCYQFVITSLLSIKDSRNILISVNYTINLYIFITNLVDNYIIFPYRIFIICPKADPFG